MTWTKMKLTACIAAAVAMLCSTENASAQRTLAGLYNSPKGFGLQVDIESKTAPEFSRIVLYADSYGIFQGRTTTPGAVLSFTRDYIFASQERQDVIFNLYAGAGATAGYVHDFEKGSGSLYAGALSRRMGFAGALAGNIGVRADFGRRLVLDASLRADLGLFARAKDENGSVLFSFYRNGALRCLYPQLSLLYRF